jgi:hypothetical protein
MLLNFTLELFRLSEFNNLAGIQGPLTGVDAILSSSGVAIVLLMWC